MTLHIYTARISYRGPDALDITRGTAEKARKAGLPRPPGEFLAPSAGLVFPTLRRLKTAKTDAQRACLWAGYVAAYRAEMYASWCERRAEWVALLARPRVTLQCFCVDATRCHRTLAATMLAKCGAIYHGEPTDPRPSCVVCDPDGGACECGFRRPDEGPPPGDARIDRAVKKAVAFSGAGATENSATPRSWRTGTSLLPKGGES